MADLGPPSAALTAATGGSGPAPAPSLGLVAVTQLPERLAQNLQRPILISGTVISTGDDGATHLRTAAGEVVFRAQVQLAADTPVFLQLGGAQPAGTAKAFANLTSPGTAGTASGTSAAVLALPLPTGAEPPAVTTTLGALARAALAGSAGPLRALPVLLPPGTVLPGLMLSTPETPAAPPAVPPVSEGPVPEGGAVTAEPLPSARDGLVAGARLSVRILPGPLPVSAPVAAPVPALPFDSVPGGLPLPGADGSGAGSGPGDGRLIAEVSGTVTEMTPAGQPVLTTPLGSLALFTRTRLPLGFALTVELAWPSQLIAGSGPAAGGATAGQGAGRPGAWPVLDEMASALGGSAGAGAPGHPALHALLHGLPQPNGKLAAAMSFFLDAARRGDGRGWLGEQAGAALEQAGRGDLLEQLDDSFRELSRQAAATPPGEWRPFPLPMVDHGLIQRFQFYIRARDDDDDDEAGKRGGGQSERRHRFLIDLELSRLGPLQLDGLVRTKRFDLILRSLTPLDESLRFQLLGAFTANLEAVSFTGGLSFQSGSRGWIKPATITAGKNPGRGVLA